jgi:molybdopterin converting factor small subunit
MTVLIPSQLRSYTAGAATVESAGASLAEVLADLDRRFPGLRFRVVDEQDRIRPHVKFFVSGALARTIAAPVGPEDEVMIVGALSGG